MNTKPEYHLATTATRQKDFALSNPDFSEIDRQARGFTYLEMSKWVKAMPETLSAREKRYRATLLSCIESELEDLGYELAEVTK